MDKKYDASNLFVKGYKYDKWYKKLDIEKNKSQPEENIAERVKLIPSEGTIQKDSDDTTKSVISPMPTLEGCEEKLKESKGQKTLTANKLLTKLPVLLAQRKAENLSYKVKNDIR